MDIDQRIVQGINKTKNIHHIVINKRQFKKLRQETLTAIKISKIQYTLKNDIEDLKVYVYNPDCFAYKDSECLALKELDCEHCKFYRNDIKMIDIEEDIINYER